jgi:hypothetical protein
MDGDRAVSREGTGAIAQDHSVAAGAWGVAVGRDTHGDIRTYGPKEKGE